MPDAPARTKVDRDEVFLEYTKSVCPVCKRVVDAQVNARGGKVYLRKRCPEHGEFEAVTYSDARMYMDTQRFNKPGTIPLAFQTEVDRGCPLDCGMCPEHKQHACIGLIEVNTGCNLDCPICFSDSGHQPDGFSLTREQVEAGIDAFVRAEGEPEMLMFSGGEPTIHPQILEFIRVAKEKGVKYPTLNTNGIRLARDRRFLERLGKLHPFVYLQFDGFRESTYLDIRGKDLREIKRRALDNCAEVGLKVALVAAIERGVNDDELGDILRFGLRHPAVNSVVFQPVTHSGRHLAFDPLDRITNADVIKGIVAQMPETFREPDFFPVPCCSPTCRSVTYLITDGEEVVPIPRLLDIEDYLDYVQNRVLPNPDVRFALEKLWSASAVPGTDSTAAQLLCAMCDVELPEVAKQLVDRVFMIVIQDFQDAYTLNVRQLMKCCVVEIVPDGRLIPFCAYNSVGYREQVRAQLSGVDVPTVVPNAVELGPVLVPTPHGSMTVPGGSGRNGRDATNVGERLG